MRLPGENLNMNGKKLLFNALTNDITQDWLILESII